MNRAPVCHYYQAGCCRNGSSCRFTHPTVRCRVFLATGWCPYGYSCYFWHDRSRITSTPFSPPRKPCRFFANNQCKYGDECTFSHEIESNPTGSMTLAEYRASRKLSQLTLATALDSSHKRPDEHHERHVVRFSNVSGSPTLPIPAGGTTSKSTRVPVLRPSLTTTQIKMDNASNLELCRLQALEISRLLKAFPPDRLREVTPQEDGKAFFVIFSPTDPDWAHSVREFHLTVHINNLYPSKPLKISVLDNGQLPQLLLEQLNMAIGSWIANKHRQILDSNLTELYLQPFFRWLDRNLDTLFTRGLHKVKTQFGIEREVPSISQIDLQRSADSCGERSRSHSSIESVVTAPLTATNQSDGHSETLYSSDSEKDSDVDHLLPLLSGRSASCVNLTYFEKPAEKNNRTVSVSEDVEEEKGEWIKSVESPKMNMVQGSNQPNEIASDELSRLAISATAPSVGRGTQNVVADELRLIGRAGTLIHRKFSATLHCTRCRLPFDWVFSLHGNDLINSDSSVSLSTRLRSLPPHHATCVRCGQTMGLVFQATMAHAFESCLGTLHLQGCVADDVHTKMSEFLVLCTECSRYIKVPGVGPQQPTSKRCHDCHSIVGIQFGRISLKQIHPAGCLALPLKNSSGTCSLPRRQRRTPNSSQNPLIQDGFPLPDYGTCKHYRKSYRWLRFPCCGRLEPCDVCHNEAAGDGHELELATRMVCGYCSKEQNFSSTRPCVRCGKTLVGVHSAHWEGGKGCRNKVTMSRKDTRKYAQTNKTVSRAKLKSQLA
ncbi:unnamed protein product [Dicrocoelium dendriticum]|nr:unnamed protein product [Dicrocoelium dendriticum]